VQVSGRGLSLQTNDVTFAGTTWTVLSTKGLPTGTLMIVR
jgi:hypothetical protein